MINILIFSPHPDDAEISIGGFILLHANEYKIKIINLSAGEHSSNGDKIERLKESKFVENRYKNISTKCLFFEDANIQHTVIDQQKRIIRIIREYTPGVILTSHYTDEHPDHLESYLLVKNAIYKAGLNIYPELGEQHTCKYLFFYSQNLYNGKGSMFIDISSVIEEKLNILSKYRSQLIQDNSRVKTYSNTRIFQKVLAKDKYCGSLINTDYAEEIISYKKITIKNIFDIVF